MNIFTAAERQIFIQDLGDWTHKVWEALKRDTHRPIWVQGPFSSPYDRAADYDNQILVAGKFFDPRLADAVYSSIVLIHHSSNLA
jgi:hypothetical protein